MVDNKNMAIASIIIVSALIIIITLCLKSAIKKTNIDKERTSKFSMVSDKGHSSEESDKCFRLSTIVEEDYTNLNSNRISIVIIVEPDGSMSANA